MNGITENLSGVVNIDERHEMTAYDDILNIIDATISLVVPGDLFSNEGNDTVTISNSTLNGAVGTSLFLGSGDDQLSMKNVTLNVATLAGSGNDYVSIIGDAQSQVTLKLLSGGDTTLSLGSGDDILEIASTLAGDGTINFGDGADTLYFNGGKLTSTGAISALENISVSTAGGNLGRNLTLSGTENVLTFNGNLTGTDASRVISVTGETATLNTTNNVKLNVALSISKSAFTHTAGGSLEISDNTGTSAIALTSSTANFHNLVLAGNKIGISATNTDLTLDNVNISNHSGEAIKATSGSLMLNAASFANNKRALNLSGTPLRGSDLTFSQNNVLGNGGALLSNRDVEITEATFSRNIASGSSSTANVTVEGGAGRLSQATAIFSNANFASNTASGYGPGNSYARGGALFVGSEELHVTNGDFLNNVAVIGRYNGTVYAEGGALYAASGYAAISGVEFRGNIASSYTSARGGAINAVAENLNLANVIFNSNSAIGNYSFGGAIFAENSIVNMSDTVFTNNSASKGGALYVGNNSIVTYSVTSGKNLVDTGNSGTGGFLFVEDTGSKFTFDIAEDACLTIGDTTGKDNFYGYGTITKNGDGYLLVNSDISGYSGYWVISGGTLELARIARTITLDNWTIGVGTMLKLSSLNDTINMSTDKNIGIIDLGGGSDTINTGGYTLNGGELRISTLTFTGGGIVKSAITTRDPNAGFNLTLSNVKLESAITGGNAADVIRITQESTVKGAMSLGGGKDTITATAKAIFDNTLDLGDGDDTLTFQEVVFNQTVDLGGGNDKFTATGTVTANDAFNTGDGDDTLTLATGNFAGSLNLGAGNDTLSWGFLCPSGQ